MVPKPKVTTTFGPSRAKVEVRKEADVFQRIKEITGRDVTRQDLASLTGASEEAIVRVESDIGYSGRKEVTLKANSTRYNATRTLKIKDGVAEIHNDYFRVEDEYQGKGLGSEIFARQVENAAKLGFQKITTSAAKGHDYNGYYTWPRLGYDAPIPASVKAKLPDQWQDAKNVSDLQINATRREWWKKNGEWIDLTFDLTEGSLSRRILAAYLVERSAR